MRSTRVGAALRSCAFGIRYLVAHHILRSSPPLIRGLVLTNRCNLRCQHCRVPNRGAMDLTFSEAVGAMEAFRREGGRCLYLEGGEPFLWHDDDRGLDDVVGRAHELGFLTVVVYTNGTLPIRTSADTVFVSVDGLRDTHDALRGRSFDRIMGNIRDSGHPSLYVNCTINNLNKDGIPEFCDYLSGIPNVRATFFYFHTPYYGCDHLHVSPLEKQRVLRRLLQLRRRYNILNSKAGLKSALHNDWRRPLPVCSVYEKGTVHSCCRFSGNPDLCRQCGYLSYTEIDQVLKLRPSALINAMKYF